MKTNSNRRSNLSRRRGTLLAITCGLIAASTPLQAADRPTRGGGGGDGGDIIVFDIVDSVVDSRRPAGGGGGGNIIVFDIVDSAAASGRPAGGGGGGDIVVFDIIDSVATSGRPAGGGGGDDIIVFDIIDSVAAAGRPAVGGGGQDIIVFDIIDSVAGSGRPAGSGGGADIIVFDIVDSVAASASPLPVLMVIANQDFYYSEYADTRRSIEALGAPVRVAAASTKRAVPHPNSGQPEGSDGGVIPDLALARTSASDYSAIVFVGGWGSSMYQYAYNDPNLDGRIDNFYAHAPYNADDNLRDGRISRNQTAVNDLINDFIDQDKYVAAICHGVTVLAWARVDGASPLEGRTVSVPFIGSPATFYLGAWYADFELSQYEQVVANGAIANETSGAYGDPSTSADDVVVDGRIITAENYDSARLFGAVVARSVIAGGTVAR